VAFSDAINAWCTSAPVPLINPGPLSYKLVETVLGLGLTHSPKPYPKPLVEHYDMIHAMMQAAAKVPKGRRTT